MEKRHHVPKDKELQVHAGDYVEAGDPLIRGRSFRTTSFALRAKSRCTSTCSTK